MSDLLQMGVLSAIALACGLLSPFLVLKKMTMFANSLSHTVLFGIVLAFLITGGTVFNLPVLGLGALLAALMTALFTGGLIRIFGLQEDASIGLVFTALFAMGIACVTLFTRNVHLGIEAVMGNADLLQFSDFKMAVLLASLNLGAITLFFRPFQILGFDLQFAKTIGIRSSFFHFLLLFLVSLTSVGAFRAVGVLLVLAFLVGPFLTARLFCHRLFPLLILTPLIGIFASVVGVLISRACLNLFALPLSTGGSVAVLIGLIYVVGKTLTSVKIHSCERKLPS